MLTTVTLLGDLGQKFGFIHQFDLSRPSEVFAALAVNFWDFRPYLLESEANGVGYHAIPCDDGIVVAPIVTGSGGAEKIFAGLAVIGISAFVPFSIGLLGSGVLTGGAIGAGLILQGAGELFAPQRADESLMRSSAIAPADTIRQGSVIPICFGKVFVPGRPISAGTNVTVR